MTMLLPEIKVYAGMICQETTTSTMSQVHSR